MVNNVEAMTSISEGDNMVAMPSDPKNNDVYHDTDSERSNQNHELNQKNQSTGR